MFKKFTLKNYKTHKLTTIELSDVTLLIGNNSSGKTNLLSGIQHFANLVRRSFYSSKKSDSLVQYNDYFPHKHRLANESETMSIEVFWSTHKVELIYNLELYFNNKLVDYVGCREKIKINISGSEQEWSNGFEKETQNLELKQILESSAESSTCIIIANNFFANFTNTFSFHFQPSFLKGHIDFEDNNNQDDFWFPKYLGYEGRKLEKVVLYIKEKEEKTFSRFIVLMRRFNSSFQGVRFDRDRQHLIWEFDLGRSGMEQLVEEFTSDSISDGFIKAAAIALVVSIQRSPALILIEEIENGINPGNIQEIMNWIWQATVSEEQWNSPQFILTTHSPSVLREFHKHLDCVYTTRLKKKGFQSDVRNLGQSLDTLIGIGALEGETFTDPETGKLSVEMPKYQVAELWYSGTIG